MSYKIHKKGMCDKCGEKPEKWKVPFIYKDMNDKSHPDVNGQGYRQYYICDDCKEVEERINSKRRYIMVQKWEKIEK